MITCRSLYHGGLGRFGNTCWTLAGTIGIATRNGQPFAFEGWRTADNALFGQPIDDMADYFVNPLPKVPGGLTFNDIPYHWEYRDYSNLIGNFNINSHLQDPVYFEDYMPLIQHYFRMKDEPPQNEFVAVHYRAGDYIDDPNAYHPRCSKQYYQEAISKFHEGTQFAVFTDDIEAAAIRIPIIGATYYSGNYLSDFALMKRCKSFITANSSFSLMAAILGEHPEKKIICPSCWFGTAANGLQFYGYPKNAIVI